MMKYVLATAILLASYNLNVQAQGNGYDAAEAMKALEMLMGGDTEKADGESAQTIHFRQLKGFLPKEYDGMKRTSVEAGKNAAFGMNISYAEATYKGDDNARITIRVQDISAMSGFMRMAQFAWASQEMERESETGYERTTKIDGYPAQESFRYSGESGDLEIIVGDRFMIDVDSYKLPMEKTKAFVSSLGLKKLAAMQPEEVE